MLSSGALQESTSLLSIPGYSIEALICVRDTTRVYRALRLSDGESVMLKCLASDQEALEAIVSLKHEYEIGRHLLAPTVIRMHALEYYRNLPVVVLEDFGGDSLLNLMGSHPFELPELLSVAVQIARGLGEVHAANIIHKDINPSNVVYNPTTGVLKIIDFGISSSLTREQAAIVNPQVVEASLPYVSPEQTGRMNRSIDYRSDFYSFGVTLYELLTGQLPFSVSEPIEWFHCHIAKQPQPPYLVDPKIPQVVSDIVMKLMAKMAEDRYQSAGGIEADLRNCLDQLKATGYIERFDLGRDEIPQHFQIPQKLYGREQEVSRLLRTFDRVTQGTKEIALVAGYSGIGKTCLIRELYKPITERRGHFISGKFDQLHRNVPYSAVLSALRDMMRQLLTESEEQLALWKQKILTAVDPNGQLIVDMLKDLVLIIGPQSPVPDLPPLESEQRFNRVFTSFLKVFAQPQHPLAMFLDDLQWADSASLNLLEMLTHPDTGATNLMLIGAYRDNEVTPGHPLMLIIKNIAEQGVTVDEIRLQPLGLQQLAALLADTLSSSGTEVAALAELVLKKTAGNPFFTEEFLKDLNKQQLIEYAPEQRCWQWDTEKIRAQKVTDNVVELMKNKLRQLEPESLQLMQLAACIGNCFQLSELSVVSEQQHRTIAQHLRSAMSVGVIAPIGDAYHLLELDERPGSEVSVQFAFAHDRIQQAAYALLDHTSKQITHLKIGRLLLDKLPESEQQQQLFDITNHLNLGVSFIEDAQERLQLCRLNLKAGKRAKATSAYQAAYLYLAAALALLPPQAWKICYELTLELHEEAAEAAYLNKDYEKMDELLTSGFDGAADLLHRIKLYQVQISAHIARGQLAEAVQVGRPLMAKLGYSYPKKIRQYHVVIQVLRNLWAFRKLDIQAQLNAPETTDPKHIAAHAIGDRMSTALIFIEPDMFSMMTLESARIQYRFGLCSNTPGAWAIYGMILASQLNKPDQGLAFARLSLDLCGRFQVRPALARMMHVYNSMVLHWKEPIRNSFEPLQQTYRMNLENGDFQYAALAWVIGLFNKLDAGVPLRDLQQELEECHSTIKALKQGHNLDYIRLLQQACDNLTGIAPEPTRLNGRYYNIEEMRKLHARIGDKSLIAMDHEISLWIHYLLGNSEELLNMTDSFAVKHSLVGGFFKSVRCYMIDSLIRLANVKIADSRQQRKLLREVNGNLKKLKTWAKSNPENFRNKYLIVDAERLQVLGRDFEAHARFDEAIQYSAENGFIQEQALANELCGAMHFTAERMILAQPYLRKSSDLYYLWGAEGKVAALQRQFPQLLTGLRHNTTAEPNANANTRTQHLENIDITSLMKALKSIAEEKVHSRMLEAIIATSVEFAGAQRGLLILRSGDNNYCIEAEYSVDGKTTVLQSLPIEQDNLPQPLIYFVMRTKSSVVIHDAQEPQSGIPDLNRAPYIQQRQVRSVLCIPIVSEADDDKDLIAILYLENNLATGTFTQERFDTLEIIAMAAAGRLELSRKAAFDGLTGLFNHEYFQNALNQEVTASRTHHRDMGLLLIDIDHFKQFNDTWGHQVGDLVLREVAQLIKSGCRTSDLVARYGGEEMAVILPTTSIPRAEEVAERLRSTIAGHRVLHEGNQLTVTISIGVAMLNDNMKNKDELIRKADTALYRSKKNGRNRVTIDKS